jgi:ribosomal protein S8
MLRIVALMCLVLLPFTIKAQTAVEYMDYLTSQDDQLSKKYMSYMSEVAHGGRARKMERRRQEVINEVREVMRDCSKAKPFKGDASLRDAYKDYYSVLLSIFTEDYHKIVDMEEIAERSYDGMEAYLLVQEKAEERLDIANDNLRTIYNAFAAKNNVRLVEGPQSKLSRKLVKVSKVNAYMHQTYLIFFKSNVHEFLFLEAMEKKDITAMEQHRGSLAKYSEEGLIKLDTVKNYNGDGSLITACRKVLEFQKSESQKFASYTDFLMKDAEFTKTKAAFDAKGSKASSEDVKAFNASVANYNSAINEYNKANNELNNQRSKVLSNWDITRKRFMDHHVPH